MFFKHRFILIDKEENSEKELANCTDRMTAHFLANHYRGVYGKDSKFGVTYKFGCKAKTIC